MDVLSQAIVAMRTGLPRSFLVVCHSPWGRRYHPVAGAGFHVILQGSAWLIPAGGDPLALGLGDVVLLPHGRLHGMADRPDIRLTTMDHEIAESQRGESHTVRIGPDRPGDQRLSTVMLCGMYRLDHARPHPLIRDLPEVVHLPARLGQHPELRAAVDLLAFELQSPRTGGGVAVTALLDLLLVQILRAWYDGQPAAGWGAALADPAISAALHLIHQHPEQKWTVAKLGAEAGLSRAAFARRFRELVDQTPLSYLTWWRMTLAARLLRGSDEPLSAVARQVGYASEFAFANAFKREYGTAPGRYRQADAHTGA